MPNQHTHDVTKEPPCKTDEGKLWRQRYLVQKKRRMEASELVKKYKNQREDAFSQLTQKTRELEECKELLREAVEGFNHIESKRGASCIADGCTCCHDTARIFLNNPKLKKILEE